MPPRPLRPKDEPVTTDGVEGAEAKSGKRRAVSTACIPCRKRKSKCDGALPECSTCTHVYRTECFYDPDSDYRRKGALKRDIQSLQQQNDALEVIVASLRNLPEDESIALLHDLRNASSVDDLAASLRNTMDLTQTGDRYLSISSGTRSSNSTPSQGEQSFAPSPVQPQQNPPAFYGNIPQIPQSTHGHETFWIPPQPQQMAMQQQNIVPSSSSPDTGSMWPMGNVPQGGPLAGQPYDPNAFQQSSDYQSWQWH